MRPTRVVQWRGALMYGRIRATSRRFYEKSSEIIPKQTAGVVNDLDIVSELGCTTAPFQSCTSETKGRPVGRMSRPESLANEHTLFSDQVSYTDGGTRLSRLASMSRQHVRACTRDGCSIFVTTPRYRVLLPGWLHIARQHSYRR